MDTLTADQRHITMSHIKGKNTVPEKTIRSALFKAGFRFRVCDRRFPGRPDVVLPGYYAVIFINGCFWHAHENCSFFRMPRSNIEFWKNKFARNKERDAMNLKQYREKCWRVCIVWECALRGKNSRQKTDAVVRRIMEWLESPGNETSSTGNTEDYLEIRGGFTE